MPSKKKLKKRLQHKQPAMNNVSKVEYNSPDFEMVDGKFPEEAYNFLIENGLKNKRFGLYKQAVVLYIEAIKANPYRYEAYYSLGKVLYILEYYEESVRAYQIALEFGCSDYRSCLKNMGHSLIDFDDNNRNYDVLLDYRKSIDPYFRGPRGFASEAETSAHERDCFEAGINYMNNLITIK